MPEYPDYNGSPFDRGGADAWYRRPYQPHYYRDGQLIPWADMTVEEVEAYRAGWLNEFGQCELETEPRTQRSLCYDYTR